MDIKLKDKILFLLKIIIGASVIFMICFGIFYVVDIYGNGLVLDWIADKFVSTSVQTNTTTGAEFYKQEISWFAVKDFLLKCFCIVSLFISAVIYFTIHFYTKRKVADTEKEAGKLIRRYMDTENARAEDVFAQQYAEIGTEMERVKSVMRHHEQVLKEESRRKSDLLTYLAHDLKTPLTSVMGYLSLLNEAPDMPEAQKEKVCGDCF